MLFYCVGFFFKLSNCLLTMHFHVDLGDILINEVDALILFMLAHNNALIRVVGIVGG